MSNFDAEWFNCFLCDRVVCSLSLSSFAQFTCILRARSIRSIDISCVSEPWSINLKIARTNMRWGGGGEKKERKKKGKKGKEGEREKKRKEKDRDGEETWLNYAKNAQ